LFELYIVESYMVDINCDSSMDKLLVWY